MKLNESDILRSRNHYKLELQVTVKSLYQSEIQFQHRFVRLKQFFKIKTIQRSNGNGKWIQENLNVLLGQNKGDTFTDLEL